MMVEKLAVPRDLIGDSSDIRELRSEIEIVACSDAKVLITGESGVGKEVVARAIHDASARRNGPFVAINCAGIPETLLESEMFGHARGSFTGAYRDKAGKLETAARGTVFLDEIGEMSLRMQVMFLRFLETGEIQKVGAERNGASTNVRIISATNRVLSEHIINGHFRKDLFFRLNVVHLIVPPLRERRVDIPLLVEHFLRRFGAHIGTAPRPTGLGVSGLGTRVRVVTPEAVAVLSAYSWPGNVRQLENVIERLVVMSRREVIGPEDLPKEIGAPAMAALPKREHQDTIAEELFKRLVQNRESFWTTVYPLYMNREITRATVRDVIHKGLQEARGNYKIVLQMFNIDSKEYKRFLDFLRKHDCQLPFKEYRTNRCRTTSELPEERYA